jgi:hypothetical protein
MSDSTADGRLVQNILDVVFAPLHEDEKAPHDWLVRMKTGIDRHLRKHAFEREGSLTKRVRQRMARNRRQETDDGQRWLRQSSHVANPAGGSSIGSLPSSSPGVGMSMLSAHSASSSSTIGQVVCGASAWR